MELTVIEESVLEMSLMINRCGLFTLSTEPIGRHAFHVSPTMNVLSSSHSESNCAIAGSMYNLRISSSAKSLGVLGKLNTRKGKMRTAAAVAIPPTIDLKNERLSMRGILA